MFSGLKDSLKNPIDRLLVSRKTVRFVVIPVLGILIVGSILFGLWRGGVLKFKADTSQLGYTIAGNSFDPSKSQMNVGASIRITTSASSFLVKTNTSGNYGALVYAQPGELISVRQEGNYSPEGSSCDLAAPTLAGELRCDFRLGTPPFDKAKLMQFVTPTTSYQPENPNGLVESATAAEPDLSTLFEKVAKTGTANGTSGTVVFSTLKNPTWYVPLANYQTKLQEIANQIVLLESTTDTKGALKTIFIVKSITWSNAAGQMWPNDDGSSLVVLEEPYINPVDYDVLNHEYGHVVDWKKGHTKTVYDSESDCNYNVTWCWATSNRAFAEAFNAVVAKGTITGYATKNKQEMFAEFANEYYPMLSTTNKGSEISRAIGDYLIVRTGYVITWSAEVTYLKFPGDASSRIISQNSLFYIRKFLQVTSNMDGWSIGEVVSDTKFTKGIVTSGKFANGKAMVTVILSDDAGGYVKNADFRLGDINGSKTNGDETNERLEYPSGAAVFDGIGYDYVLAGTQILSIPQVPVGYNPFTPKSFTIASGSNLVKAIVPTYGNVPGVKTIQPTNSDPHEPEIFSTSVYVEGEIVDQGGSLASVCGFEYAETLGGVVNKVWTQNCPAKFAIDGGWINNLKPNTSYSLRAFAKNVKGIGYGQWVNFSTPAETLPVVTTGQPSNLTSTTVTLNGSYSLTNNISNNSYGFYYHVVGGTDLTVSNPLSSSVNGAINFTLQINITPGQTYEYRAYSRNDAGVGYGQWVKFAAPGGVVGNPPTVQTLVPYLIGKISIIGLGNITAIGCSAPTERGFQFYSGPSMPLMGPSKVSDLGSYAVGQYKTTKNIEGLQPSTVYKVRAFATNSCGSGFGEWLTVTTSSSNAVLPTVQVSAPSNITYSSILPNGNLTATGGSPVMRRGFQYGLSQTSYTSTYDNATSVDGFLVGAYSKYPGISGLTANTTYYIRAFAINCIGTAVSPWITFTTSDYSVPNVITLQPSVNLTSSTILPQGKILSTGGLAVTQRGFQYGFDTTSYTTVYDSGSYGVGEYAKYPAFTAQKGRTYYIRAIATNAKGTAYGNWITYYVQP